MKIYGEGVFTAPASNRVVWDFADGPFDTVNSVLLAEAKRRGYSFEPPKPTQEKAPVKRADTKPKDTPKRRGRKPKEGKNVNAKAHRAD